MTIPDTLNHVATPFDLCDDLLASWVACIHHLLGSVLTHNLFHSPAQWPCNSPNATRQTTELHNGQVFWSSLDTQDQEKEYV